MKCRFSVRLQAERGDAKPEAAQRAVALSVEAAKLSAGMRVYDIAKWNERIVFGYIFMAARFFLHFSRLSSIILSKLGRAACPCCSLIGFKSFKLNIGESCSRRSGLLKRADGDENERVTKPTRPVL